MKTTEYLDRSKVKLGITSDYALAKELGVSTSAIISYRNGRASLGIETSTKVGKILGIDSHRVYADGQLERAKNAEQSAFWTVVSEKFSASFKGLMLRRSRRVSPMRSAS
jgi:transcriptional regulator with XRE-family HTH domain